MGESSLRHRPDAAQNAFETGRLGGDRRVVAVVCVDM
jgi:hypothetical protein